jgi:hypothetical protein
MYLVAFVLAVAAGAFYIAGTEGIFADPPCTGSGFRVCAKGRIPE